MKQAKKCLGKHYESPEITVALLTTSITTPPSYDEGDWDIND